MAASPTAPISSLKLFAPNQPRRHHHSPVAAKVRRHRPWPFPSPPPSPTLNPRCRGPRNAHRFQSRAISSDGNGAAEATSKKSSAPPPENETDISSSSQEGYLGLFVRMLGLDNDPLDREQAIITLWKYSGGGKSCIDGIMQFPGCINLVVSLLKSDSSSTCEAAAGLLRNVSSLNSYRDTIAESGAIEEIAGVLCQDCLTSEVKEQTLCTLWNLSISEQLRVKMANSYLLGLIVKFLDDEEIKIKEAIGGILANFALSPPNHSMMVEAGVIPKLADLLKKNAEGFNVVRKEAKTALLELSKDDYYRILIIEEGLVRVPMVGASAFKSFTPPTYSWPTLPDGIKLQRSSRPSRYGASDLLLGLNIPEKNFELEEAKVNAIVGRSQQQFLARIGAIGMEDGRMPQIDSSFSQQYTLLPWLDGVARLVLILELEDFSAITRAAQSIADASISEQLRISFKEAGAVRNLLKLLRHTSLDVRQAAAHALERLSVSHELCWTIEAESGLNPLVNILKQTHASENLLEKTVKILSRILDPAMKTKFHDKMLNGSEMPLDALDSSMETGGSTNPLDIVSEPGVTSREKVMDEDVIACLVKLLRTSSPSLQVNVASILEYAVKYEPLAITSMAYGIGSGLEAFFQHHSLAGIGDMGDDQLEPNVFEVEEIGLAVSATSRLLVKLLENEQFRSSINLVNFVALLRKILKSSISLSTKEWVAACLVKLESEVGCNEDLGYPIDREVILYEAIPRLVEQMRISFSSESKEAAVIELNEIVSRGVVEFSRAVAAAGGIFPLVKLIEEGSGDALEASLAILYNLSMDSENQPAIIAAGAVPILKRIVLIEGPQWRRALDVLRALSV